MARRIRRVCRETLVHVNDLAVLDALTDGQVLIIAMRTVARERAWAAAA